MAILLPGALTIWLSFHDGGYLPGAVALVVVELILLFVVRVSVSRAPWTGFSVPLVLAVGALGALALWALHSQEWSHAPARAIAEYNRVLLYVLTLALFGSLAFSVRRARWMLYGVAGAIVAVCAAGFIARTLPELIAYAPDVHPERLSYPLSYWNSLGILAAVGLILCGHLACSTRDPWPARVLGAAAVPLLSATLYYTFSRGGTWVAVAGVVLYVALGRPRGLLSGALATAPPALVTLATVNPAGVLTRDPLSSEAIAAGHRIAATVALCVLGAGALRAALLPLDRRLDRLSLPAGSRRPALVMATAAGIAVVAAGCAAADLPGVVGNKYEQFSASEQNVPHSGASRLLSASSNGRQEHWDVASATYRANPVRGSGAGTWALEWSRRRTSGLNAQDAHSLYLEIRAELGIPGLLLLIAALLLVLGAFLARARGPDRALFAALFAAGLAWAVHAGIDWDWEMPAATLWLFALGGLALAAPPGARGPRPSVALPVKVITVGGLALLAILPLRMAVSEARMGASLDAVRSGDCAVALPEARGAVSALGERPAPYQVIGFCELRRQRPGAAADAFRRAVHRDPENWELRHELAVAQALSGRDPRRNADLAALLNPHNEDVQTLAAALRGATAKRGWRRIALAAQTYQPGPPTP